MQALDSTYTTHPIQDRWGEAWGGGFAVLPVALMRHQHALGLDAGAMVVLINILSAWWYRDRLPFPSTHTLAKRMGVSPRTVQRHLEELERLELIRRVRQRLTEPDLDAKVTKYDPSGLVEQLKGLEKGVPSKAQRERVVLKQLEPVAVPTAGEAYATHLN